MVTSTTVVRSTATLERVQDRIRGTGIMLIVVRKVRVTCHTEFQL